MKFLDMNVDDVIKALIADDPELANHEESLRQSFDDLKKGRVVRTVISEVAQTRSKSGLSQAKFAERLGISVNTLRSWEQGHRKPSGAAATLLGLLNKHPELVAELR
ncbi:helix-turn-helix domain-containing protein [Pelistega europaea]|uniref:Type II toxin-antitoxin system MqsA family antitoxin n=1 Tax=Pelistega europaea TaxID=106147 RepID=A0A7Y4LBC1_9BURK|nr:type II toxin-antitoxin system MqsA family antitoxin [Pelistega europaea]NOL50333.1 type II toxin-antitoxin system MqsA family antitoxin [Pelistega europaea]